MGLWYQLCHNAARIAASGLWQIRRYGVGNVPSKGGVVLASNHQSYLDPPLIAASMTRPVHFMARRSLFKIPGLGALIASLKAFPIDRDKGDVKGVKKAIERLQAGHALLVFPEGTRTRDGKMATMKPGIRILSRRANVPIVPVLVEGAYDVWPSHRPIAALGQINITFGRPFDLGDRSNEEIGELLVRKLTELAKVPHRKLQKETRNGE